jgi:hypothetical protein
MTLAINQLFTGFVMDELRAVRNSPYQRHRRARRHRETPQAHANSIADVLSEAAENGEAEPAAALNLAALNLAACLKDARTDGLPARISTRGDAVTVKAGRATRRLELTEAQTQIVQRVIMLASDRERAA